MYLVISPGNNRLLRRLVAGGYAVDLGISGSNESRSHASLRIEKRKGGWSGQLGQR